MTTVTSEVQFLVRCVACGHHRGRHPEHVTGGIHSLLEQVEDALGLLRRECLVPTCKCTGFVEPVMAVDCAWCNGVIQEGDRTYVSHGICPGCKERWGTNTATSVVM